MTEDELAHYGVKGMKWGQRQSATGTQIVKARQRLIKQSKSYREQSKKLGSLAQGSPKRRALETKLRKQHQAYLKNPDRVIANRMTRGEKIATVILSGQTPMTALVGLGTIASTSAISRRIEYKQQNGGYDKLPKGAPAKRIGFQRGRSAVISGAQAAPMILSVVGPTLAKNIGTRAAANRAAAQVAKPTGIGSVANKLKYIKPKGGVHTITTMR